MKAFAFLGREIQWSVYLSLRPGLFFSHRRDVANAGWIYVVLSSLIVRILMRLFDSRVRGGYVPLQVRYASGLTISYPLRGYLQNPLDVFETYSDYYYRLFSEQLPINLKKGDFVIDIGAHVGTFSLPIAHRTGATVIAVEPSTENARYLAKSIQLNRLDDRVQLITAAIGPAIGETEFFEGDASTRGGTVRTKYTSLDSAPRLVKLTTLQQLIRDRNISVVRLLKMDCEGAEYGALYALDRETLARIETIILEIHPQDRQDPQALMEFLRRAGFLVRGNELQNGCWEVACRRTAVATVEVAHR